MFKRILLFVVLALVSTSGFAEDLPCYYEIGLICDGGKIDQCDIGGETHKCVARPLVKPEILCAGLGLSVKVTGVQTDITGIDGRREANAKVTVNGKGSTWMGQYTDGPNGRTYELSDLGNNILSFSSEFSQDHWAYYVDRESQSVSVLYCGRQ